VSEIRPLVIDEGQIQQMQDWHTIDERVLPDPADRGTRELVRSLVRYLVELGFAPPSELIEDAFTNDF